MLADVMKQLASSTLAPIYNLGAVPESVPLAWIAAAKLGGPEGVRSFLDHADNSALRETLPLMTGYIYEHAVDLFIAEFTRPDLETSTPEPVLVYAFITHDEEEPYLMAQVGPLPWVNPFPEGYPSDLRNLATVHAGFFDDWTFGGPAPVSAFRPLPDVPGSMYERAASDAKHLFGFYYEAEDATELPKVDRPNLHDLCVVWRLGDRKWPRFLCVNRKDESVWFVIPSEGVSRERENASKFIDKRVYQGFTKFLAAGK